MIVRPLLILLLHTAIPVKGQQFFFDRFSVSEGMAQSTVYRVIQDRNDLLWIGTQAGVSCFDGVEFHNYSASDGLAENGVRAICETRSGHIWMGHTGGGVTRYGKEGFQVIRRLAELIGSDVTSILEDTAGHIWITTNGAGVIQVTNPAGDPGTFEIRQYSGRQLSDRVFGAHLDPQGRLYFVTDPNVKLLNRESAGFDNLLLNGIPRYYITTCILVDSRGSIWFGKYNGGLYRYDPHRDDSQMYDLIRAGLTSNWVSTIFEDREGNIWAGTWGGGVARISPGGEVDLFSDRNGLPGMKIWSIMQDREENILIGTNDNGLCVYKGDYFVNYFEEDGLINSQVWSILQTGEGIYWFGTNEGISVMEPSGSGDVFRDFGRLQDARVIFLKQDMQGTVWIGTQNQGVYSYDRRGRFHFDPLINNSIPNLVVTAMELDGENHLWVGTLDGLIYYEIDHRRIDRLTQVSGLPGNEISAIFSDSANRIWVGSVGHGVTRITGTTVKQVSMMHGFTPTCFTEDQQGMIWMGTEGRGLILFDPFENRVKETFTVENGLLANLINQLSCDRFNNIYIGTNKGLNKYLRSEEKIYAYTPRSGFVGIETKPNASLLDRDGNIWFGTVEGVTRYFPSAEARKVIEPLTHITGILVNYVPIPLEEDLSLSYKQNSVIFDYRCITLNPDAVLYQIMLEGVDQEWRPPDTRTSVTYPALRPGRYTFRVKARNSDGVWNRDPVSYRFEIRPPFYMTWYFILVLIFSGGLAIFGYIQIRERTLRRENAILEEKVRDRTATVVAQKEELAQKNKDITDSIRYAKRIQFAILPEKPPFEDTFVLFKPKDIVSGDFYWFTEVDGRQYLSAVDCTGHGVPGAFMSIIGHNSLTKIVREYGILEPGQILSELNREVIGTLHQRSDSGDVHDGMDLALVCYRPEEQLLEYAGAFNPLYLVRGGELLETRADKISIGRSSFSTDLKFTNHTIPVREGDAIYLFSDGYADQFGGELMKKFKYGNFKELILKIRDEPMEEQRAILDHTIEHWRGDVEQLDDILVIGRKL